MTQLVNLSERLGLAPQHLFSLVATSDDQYFDAEIPKASGNGMRAIKMPTKGLKGVQRLILRTILSDVPIDDAAYAYVRGRSVLSAAERLCGKKALVRIDLADFFPSITYPRVYGLFRALKFDENEAFMLARLTTHQSKLPQGAPTSPAISNIIVQGLDRAMRNFSKNWEMDYVRYSDDLFFTNSRNFNHESFCKVCSDLIESAGFAVNQQKTRYYPKGVPRKTLGLLTHGNRPAIPGPARRKIRSAFHKGSRNIGWGQENAQTLKGMLEWYKVVYGKDATYYEYDSVLQTIRRLKVHISYQSI